MSVDIALKTARGHVVGELRIDGRDDFELVKSHGCEEGEMGCPCDILAIPRGFDFHSTADGAAEGSVHLLPCPYYLYLFIFKVYLTGGRVTQ